MNLADTVFEKYQALVRQQESWKGLEDSQFIRHVGLHLAWAIEDANMKVQRAYQEAFVDTALNRPSVLALGEGADYVPNKPTPSSGTVTISNRGSEWPLAALPAGTVLMSDSSRQYVTGEAVPEIPVGGSAEVPVTQRSYASYVFKVEADDPSLSEDERDTSEYERSGVAKAWYEVLLPRDVTPNVESLAVSVDTGDGTGAHRWSRDRLFTNSYADSLVYDEFYHFTDQLGVRFGNGTFGLIPPDGSVITVAASLTDGDTTLLAGQTLYPSGTRYDASGNEIAFDVLDTAGNLADVDIAVSGTIKGGTSQEDTETMRRNVHYARVFNDRLVWAEDFVYYARRSCPDINWGKCWGEETAEEMWGFNVEHINRVWLCAHSSTRTDAELSEACMAALAKVPALNRHYVWHSPEICYFTVAVKGVILQDVAMADVVAAVRAFFEEGYGENSTGRRDSVRIHEMYDGVYETGYFRHGTGAWFELSLTGFPSSKDETVLITEPEFVYQMVCVDMDASTFEFEYSSLYDASAARTPGGTVDRSGS